MRREKVKEQGLFLQSSTTPPPGGNICQFPTRASARYPLWNDLASQRVAGKDVSIRLLLTRLLGVFAWRKPSLNGIHDGVPPSTTSVWPRMKRAAGDAKKRRVRNVYRLADKTCRNELESS
jgi:hypothetical protein